MWCVVQVGWVGGWTLWKLSDEIVFTYHLSRRWINMFLPVCEMFRSDMLFSMFLVSLVDFALVFLARLPFLLIQVSSRLLGDQLYSCLRY